MLDQSKSFTITCWIGEPLNQILYWTLAAPVLVVGSFLLVLAGPVSPAQAWSEFGTPAKAPVTVDGPEIREPLFELLVGFADGDSLGLWTGDELRARVALTGRASKFPLDAVASLERQRPDAASAGRYQGERVRAVWRMTLNGDQDRPMPYSILGYHPGSLRIGRELVLSELQGQRLDLSYVHDDEARTDTVTDVRIFPLEIGYVVLDADGFLDAMLGKALDDAWIVGFVLGRDEGELVGLGVSLGRKGRHIYGEFDFSEDTVLPNGRPLASALSQASRRWLDPDVSRLPEPWVLP